MVVKNYTGERLNFGAAAERAWGEGTPAKTVLVADDVALARTVDETGRRGFAGTVLVPNIAGAATAAEAGTSLVEVASQVHAA